jgi:hypothetical protein
MNFAEMVTAVYDETDRPDLITGTYNALQAATMTFHGLEFWQKDIAECQIVFDTPAYMQKINTPALPRFRKFNYLRKYDPTLQVYQTNPTLQPPLFDVGTVGTVADSLKPITIIDPSDYADLEYPALQRVDVGYQAGGTFWIRSSTLLQYCLGGFYQRPRADVSTPDNGVTFPNYFSWIAEETPYVLIYWAASKMLKQIGMESAAARYDAPEGPANNWQGGLVQQQLRLLYTNNDFEGKSA